MSLSLEIELLNGLQQAQEAQVAVNTHWTAIFLAIVIIIAAWMIELSSKGEDDDDPIL